MNTMIEKMSLINFLAPYFDMVIGYDAYTNRYNTVAEEFAAVSAIIAKADVFSYCNPYRHPEIALTIAEMSQEEKEWQVRKRYKKAARKLLWLNLQCKKHTGEAFVVQKIDLNSEDDCIALCDQYLQAVKIGRP